MRLAVAIVVSSLLAAGCGGKSAADYQNEARAALDAGDVAKTLAVVDEALARDAIRKDAAATWRLELVRLDALAKGGRASEITADLDRLAGTYSAQLNPSLYRSLADKVKAAGSTNGAIDILAAGDQRFPAEHATFAQAIDALKGAGGLDPAEVEKLRKLGYL